MDIHYVIDVVLSVIKEPQVLICLAVVILYLSFMALIVNYKKRPPRPKKKAIAPPPKPKKEENQESEEGASEE